MENFSFFSFLFGLAPACRPSYKDGIFWAMSVSRMLMEDGGDVEWGYYRIGRYKSKSLFSIYISSAYYCSIMFAYLFYND